jgi:hypothetical protein
MRTFIISFFVIAISGYCSQAFNDSFFVDALESASVLYAQGEDKNYIEVEVVIQDNLSQAYPNAEITNITQHDESLLNALKDCVFVREGAYGEHINALQQEEFAQKMLQVFSRFSSLSFYKISGNPVINVFPLNTSTCAVAVRQDDLMVVFQGGPSD